MKRIRNVACELLYIELRRREKLKTVQYLLSHEADPCAQDAKQLTPIQISGSKGVARAFRLYAGEHGTQHDWEKANVRPMTAEEDIREQEAVQEKKKTKKKAKREKEKTVRVEAARLKKAQNEAVAEDRVKKQKKNNPAGAAAAAAAEHKAANWSAAVPARFLELTRYTVFALRQREREAEREVE